MKQYSKEFRERALELSDEIGLKNIKAARRCLRDTGMCQ